MQFVYCLKVNRACLAFQTSVASAVTTMLSSDQIASALTARDIVMKSGGFSEKEVEAIQVAILELSTGYRYFRASV